MPPGNQEPLPSSMPGAYAFSSVWNCFCLDCCCPHRSDWAFQLALEADPDCCDLSVLPARQQFPLKLTLPYCMDMDFHPSPWDHYIWETLFGNPLAVWEAYLHVLSDEVMEMFRFNNSLWSVSSLLSVLIAGTKSCPLPSQCHGTTELLTILIVRVQYFRGKNSHLETCRHILSRKNTNNDEHLHCLQVKEKLEFFFSSFSWLYSFILI